MINALVTLILKPKHRKMLSVVLKRGIYLFTTPKAEYLVIGPSSEMIEAFVDRETNHLEIHILSLNKISDYSCSIRSDLGYSQYGKAFFNNITVDNIKGKFSDPFLLEHGEIEDLLNDDLISGLLIGLSQ